MAEKIKNFLFVINDSAGLGRSRKLAGKALKQIVKLLEDNNLSVTIKRNSRSIENLGAYGLVVSLGGDGTVHGVVNSGILGKKTLLMVVEGGTGNDIVRALGLPGDVNWVFDLLKNQEKIRIVPIDVIMLEYTDENGVRQKRAGLNTLTFGIDAQINARAVALKEESRKKNSLGFLLVRFFTPVIYLAVGIKELLFNPKLDHLEFKIDVDGKEGAFQKLAMVAFGNGTTYGKGLCIAPQGEIKYSLREVFLSFLSRLVRRSGKKLSYEHMQDGKIAICKVFSTTRIRLLINVWRLIFGIHLACREVETCPDKTLPTCSSIKVTSKKSCIYQFDGEAKLLPPGEYLVSVERHGVRIAVPATQSPGT